MYNLENITVKYCKCNTEPTYPAAKEIKPYQYGWYTYQKNWIPLSQTGKHFYLYAPFWCQSHLPTSQHYHGGNNYLKYGDYPYKHSLYLIQTVPSWSFL